MMRTKAMALAAGFALTGWSVCAAGEFDGKEDGVRLALRGESAIELQAFWEPVTDWAMSAGDVAKNETLLNVSPAEAKRSYGAADFAPFMPDAAVQVGDVWEVDSEAVLRFLTQFHPGARSRLHHEPAALAGSWACLRAVNERYAEILTRSHAQFVMEEGIHFTPAQFEGRLLIDRRSGTVVAYGLALPDRYTNLDVNVPTEATRAQGNNYGVPGIGWIPRMELVGPAAPADIVWSSSIKDEVARRQLINKYYGAIDWMPFVEAVKLAEQTDKLLHVVVILGTFDDESC